MPERRATTLVPEDGAAERQANRVADGAAPLPWFDFSRIRIHHDDDAARRTRAVGARAFTDGSDVYFGRGQFAPESAEGRSLIRHELAHAAQPAAGLQRKPDPVVSATIDARAGTVILTTRSGETYTGTATTDLVPGRYVLKPDMRRHVWIISGSEGGIHFDLHLGDADPWKLTYAASVPLNVTNADTIEDRVGETVPTAGKPSEDPNFIDLAAKAGTIEMWGFPITLYRKWDGKNGSDPIRVERNLFNIDADPLAKERGELSFVYKTKAEADAAVTRMLGGTAGGATGGFAYYLGPGGHIWPTIVSDSTAPGVNTLARRLIEQERVDAKAAESLGVNLALWYIGARFPIKTKAGAPEPPSKVPSITPAAVKTVDSVVKELVSATEGFANPGKKMIEAAKVLSNMKGLTTANKVNAMLQFFKHIGFVLSKEGVVEEEAWFLMKSEDGRYAFRFLKDTGEILYGKFDMATLNYVWSVLK